MLAFGISRHSIQIIVFSLLLTNLNCLAATGSNPVSDGHFVSGETLSKANIDVPTFNRLAQRATDYIYQNFNQKVTKLVGAFRRIVKGSTIYYLAKDPGLCGGSQAKNSGSGDPTASDTIEYEVFRMTYHATSMGPSPKNNSTASGRRYPMLKEVIEYFVCGQSNYLLHEEFIQEALNPIPLTEDQIQFGHRDITLGVGVFSKTFQILNSEGQIISGVQNFIQKNGRQEFKAYLLNNLVLDIITTSLSNPPLLPLHPSSATSLPTIRSTDIEKLRLISPAFTFQGNIGFMGTWRWPVGSQTELAVWKNSKGYLFVSDNNLVSANNWESKLQGIFSYTIGFPKLVLENYIAEFPEGKAIPAQSLLKDQMEELLRLRLANSDPTRQEFLIREVLKGIADGNIHDYRSK